MQLTIQGILFDVDGTLIDNMMVHHRAWQRHLKDLGLDYTLERVKAEIHGVNLEILEKIFGDKYTHEERVRMSAEKETAYRKIFIDEFTDNIVPGALEFINAAHRLGVPMAVGTAGPKENAFFALDNLGVRDKMGHVVHSGMVAKGKPDPEVFQQAADGIDVRLQDCLIFEDSVTGAKAANNAGAPVVVLTTTHQESEFTDLEVVDFRPDFSGLRISKVKHGYLITSDA